jgi:hypothetical protein
VLPTDLRLLLIWSQISRWFIHTLAINCRRILSRGFSRDAETRTKRAYKTDYHARGLAFAPLACNSFGQQGPDILRYLWLIADRHTQRTCSGLLPSSVFPVSDAHCSAFASVSSFKACRARLYRQLVHEVLIAIYEPVTERALGRTYALQAYPAYLAFFLVPLSSRPSIMPSLPLPTPDPLSPLLPSL